MADDGIKVIYTASNDKRRKTNIVIIDDFTVEAIDEIVDVLRSLGCKITVNQTARSPKVSISGTKKGHLDLCALTCSLKHYI